MVGLLRSEIDRDKVFALFRASASGGGGIVDAGSNAPDEGARTISFEEFCEVLTNARLVVAHAVDSETIQRARV